MIPRQAISRLDASLRQAGEDITLQRIPVGADAGASVVCRARVTPASRGDQASPLVGQTIQVDNFIILSPTEITAANWKSGRQTGQDDMVPTKGNRVILGGGRKMTVEAAQGIRIAGVLVRIEMQVKG